MCPQNTKRGRLLMIASVNSCEPKCSELVWSERSTSLPGMRGGEWVISTSSPEGIAEKRLESTSCSASNAHE